MQVLILLPLWGAMDRLRSQVRRTSTSTTSSQVMWNLLLMFPWCRRRGLLRRDPTLGNKNLPLPARLPHSRCSRNLPLTRIHGIDVSNYHNIRHIPIHMWDNLPIRRMFVYILVLHVSLGDDWWHFCGFWWILLRDCWADDGECMWYDW